MKNLYYLKSIKRGSNSDAMINLARYYEDVEKDYEQMKKSLTMWQDDISRAHYIQFYAWHKLLSDHYSSLGFHRPFPAIDRP